MLFIEKIQRRYLREENGSEPHTGFPGCKETAGAEGGSASSSRPDSLPLGHI